MHDGKQMHYNSQKKEMIATKVLMITQKSVDMFTSALQVQMKFYFYRPSRLKGHFEDVLNDIPHTQKPDIDNLIKYVLDCGNKVLWDDDALIYCLGPEPPQKIWSKKPRTEIIYGP